MSKHEMHELSPELRKVLLERLAHRSTRLAKVAAIAACPDVVLTLMADQVVQTVMLLCGPRFTEQVLSTVFDQTAEAHGICRFCHKQPLRNDRTMCQACWDQARKDDESDGETIQAIMSDAEDRDDR